MAKWKRPSYKVGWFLLVLGLLTYLVVSKWSAYLDGSPRPFEIIIFLIWIALLLAPLFREVSFFGISLKKEFDNFKSEVKEQIIDLRSDIQNTIHMKTEISPQIYLSPPRDSDLSAIQEGIQPIIAQKLQEKGITEPFSGAGEKLVPENTLYLFSVRYAIEHDLNRIIDTFHPSSDDSSEKYRPRTYIQMIDFLKHMELMERDYVVALRDVLAICNAGIHSTGISEAKINFVRDVAPGLIETLKLRADQIKDIFSRPKNDPKP